MRENIAEPVGRQNNCLCNSKYIIKLRTQSQCKGHLFQKIVCQESVESGITIDPSLTMFNVHVCVDSILVGTKSLKKKSFVSVKV